jgi:hypothetical protein
MEANGQLQAAAWCLHHTGFLLVLLFDHEDRGYVLLKLLLTFTELHGIIT